MTSAAYIRFGASEELIRTIDAYAALRKMRRGDAAAHLISVGIAAESDGADSPEIAEAVSDAVAERMRAVGAAIADDMLDVQSELSERIYRLEAIVTGLAIDAARRSGATIDDIARDGMMAILGADDEEEEGPW